MGNELKLNSAEEAEVILIRLTPEEYPNSGELYDNSKI